MFCKKRKSMDAIKFKKLFDDTILPTYAYQDDAGMDIFSHEEKIIEAGKWVLVKTGFSMELPHGYEAQVRSKSGIALKSGVFCLNSPGTIDENYRGEVGVILMNLSNEPYRIFKQQKVAQMVIARVEHLDAVICDNLEKSQRGVGGFGSTGLNIKE